MAGDLFNILADALQHGGHDHRAEQRAESIAADLGYRGVWVVAQDNNLAACRFYLKNGFVLGGLDTQVYRGTAQEGKADVHFYKEIGAAT